MSESHCQTVSVFAVYVDIFNVLVACSLSGVFSRLLYNSEL